MKRVKRPHGLLPKAPQKGDKITVVCPEWPLGTSLPYRALVRRATGSRRIEHRRVGAFSTEVVENMLGGSRNGTVYRKDEGITWARGWDTPEANALRTFVALSG